MSVSYAAVRVWRVHVVWHPGALGLPGLEVEPRFFAQIGAGRLALPKQ
jgi:hypothetical protein